MQEKLDALVEPIRMAPTSSGTQPFELIVITNPEVRSRIRAMAMDQQPITDRSHLLVFAAWDNYSVGPNRRSRRTEQTSTRRPNRHRRLLRPAQSDLPPRDAETNHAHAARQAYIALGFALIAAAKLGVDSTPMEGFDPDSGDEILALRARRLRSVALLALGHRDPSHDWLVNMVKARKSHDRLVTVID